MKTGLHNQAVNGVAVRVRVESDHSQGCSDAPRQDVLWTEDGAKYLDARGGNRSHNYRWLIFRCNGLAKPEEGGDEKHYCTARVLIRDSSVSDVINAILDDGI